MSGGALSRTYQTTKLRIVAVAVVVCGFAVGMAGLLNYFKYRSTANRIVAERLVVTGRAVENVVHVALDLGLQFSEIPTLPATLDRERGTDDLIQGIDIFDNDGKLLYSTDSSRLTRPAPAAWLAAIGSARGSHWMVEDETASAAGMSLKNAFGMTPAHLALRFSRDSLSDENAEVARELALNTFIVFVIASMFASTALLAVMRRLKRDLTDAEAALDASDGAAEAAPAAGGPFRSVLQRFLQTTREVEREIADLNACLDRGVKT